MSGCAGATAAALQPCPTLPPGVGGCLNRYAVGPEGSGCPFSSIQKAIDAAVAPAVVMVLPPKGFAPGGRYVEDLRLRKQVHVHGVTNQRVFSVIVEGEVTVDLDDPGPDDIGINYTSWQGIDVFPPPGSFGLNFVGTKAQKLYVDASSFEGNTPVLQDNPGVDASGATSQIIANNCRIVGTAGGDAFEQRSGRWEGRLVDYRRTSSLDDVCIALKGTADFMTAFGAIDGRTILADTSLANIVVCALTSGALSPFDTASPSLSFVGNGAVVTTASPAFTGAGGLVVGEVEYISAGSGYDAALNGGAGVFFAPTDVGYVAIPADWIAPPPNNLTDAVDRIATAVSGLLGGGIP